MQLAKSAIPILSLRNRFLILRKTYQPTNQSVTFFQATRPTDSKENYGRGDKKQYENRRQNVSNYDENAEDMQVSRL